MRSLRHYWRNHIGTLLGTALATAVLTGALMARDDVRFSLERIAVRRIGSTEFAMESGDRYFRVSLAEDLSKHTGTITAASLSMDGYAVAGGGENRSNNVNVIGVREDFWRFSPGIAEDFELEGDEVALNERLAAELGVGPNDTILLRVKNAQLMPGEAPFATGGDETRSFSLRVKRVIGDEQFGNFNLRIHQVAPKNAFVDSQMLAGSMGIENMANVMLVAISSDNELDAVDLTFELQRLWRLADAGLELEDSGAGIKLASNRVFIEHAVERAASELSGDGILTYFIDRISLVGADGGTKGSSIPYSFVTGIDKRLLPISLSDDEIILNEWAADDLDADLGDLVELDYRAPGSEGLLEMRSATFRIAGVVPIEADDRQFMPRFPGLAEADSCRDWDPGFPIDVSLIRDADEVYWDEYGGAPKAFISLQAAQKLWENRYGRLTAIRFGGDLESGVIALSILKKLDPGAIGLSFYPVRESSLEAGKAGTDFGQLFLGLSMFLIASALMLTGMLFSFAVRQRLPELGVLSAIGFTPRHIRSLVLLEGAVIAITGALLGVTLGIVYNKLIIAGLATLWRDAVRTSAIRQHIRFPTVVLGGVIGATTALGTMFGVVLLSGRLKASQLLRGKDALPAMRNAHSKSGRMSLYISGLTFGVSVALAIIGGGTGIFFITGTLLLVSGLTLFSYVLYRLRSPTGLRIAMWTVGIKGSARRRLRSITIAALLATGIFVVVAVGSNRRVAVTTSDDRSTGTGGFELIAETTIAVPGDIGDEAGRIRFGVDDTRFDGVEIVGFRELGGDDASCLNLNRVVNPGILGVEQSVLSGRFGFAELLDKKDENDPWFALDSEVIPESRSEYVIPAIADQSVITWSLRKSLGDELIYLDEYGNRLRLVLVGALEDSIFQGNILVSEQVLLDHFPSVAGRRFFLVDAPGSKVDELVKTLPRTMGGYGIDISTTVGRLNEFHSVNNTYLNIFLVLGGLGVLVGSLGLGIVVLRNCVERRGELALLQTIGFSTNHLRGLVLIENVLPLLFGVCVGTVSALLAVAPSLTATHGISIGPTLLLVLIIALSCVVWIVIAASIATPKSPSVALSEE